MVRKKKRPGKNRALKVPFFSAFYKTQSKRNVNEQRTKNAHKKHKQRPKNAQKAKMFFNRPELFYSRTEMFHHRHKFLDLSMNSAL